jgi:hypothetical protein
MEKRYKVLLVDDDISYSESLIAMADEIYNIDIQHCEDWEEGKSLIESNHKNFNALILDGRGKLSQGAAGSNPKHLSTALSDINEMRAKRIYIPFVVNTAFYEEFSIYFDNVLMVEKNDSDNLFKTLHGLIISSDIEKIKSKYSDVFECFCDQYLPISASDNLMEVLLEIEKNTWTENSFTPLRKVIEAVYIRIHELDDTLIPYGCLRFNIIQVNFRYCELKLTGREIRDKSTILYPASKPILPQHIGWVIGPITTVCSIASHTDVKECLTKYSLQMVVHGVMDLILWFKKYVDTNHKQQETN